MSIETKLREGSQAIKQATRQADFTSRSPSERRSRVSGPMLAWVSGVAVVAFLAIPAMLAGVGGQPSGGGDVGADPSSPVAAAPVFPHLVIELPDTTLAEAYEITDTTGDRVGAHSVYHTSQLPDGEETGESVPPSDRTGRREILLRVQVPGTEFQQFDYYAALAEGTETVEVGLREVTVYLVPDEAIEEGNYDQALLQWTEAPGYEAILIPWGLDKDDALALMDGLTTIDESQWEQLKGSNAEPLVTPTTVVGSPTPTAGTVQAPEKPRPDGP